MGKKEKVLVLCEKKSVANCLKKFVAQAGVHKCTGVIFDYFGQVWDFNHMSGLRRQGDVIYLNDQKIKGFEDLQLQDFDFEAGRFVISKSIVAQNLKAGKYLPSDVKDVLIVLTNPWHSLTEVQHGKVTYPDDVLAAKYFLEHYGVGLPDGRCMLCKSFSFDDLSEVCRDLWSFDDIFASVIAECGTSK